MSLVRLQFNYAADPDCLHLPHGLERLRKAYAAYLSDEDSPVTFAEARKKLREWVDD